MSVCVCVKEKSLGEIVLGAERDLKSRQKTFGDVYYKQASPCDLNIEIMTPLLLQIWTCVCL